MSYILIEKTKKHIEDLEKILLSTSNTQTMSVTVESIKSAKNKLDILEKLELDKSNNIVSDMKAILSHTRAIDDKYNCGSVKFMHRFADFLEVSVSASLATKVRKYTTKNIHSPVCSIVASKKPELIPMPQYGDPIYDKVAAFRQAQVNELKRLTNISKNFLEKPLTFREKLIIKINKLLGKSKHDLIKRAR